MCRCCCDPHKLAYISGIFTAGEAVVFGALNVVLICVTQCAIKLPASLGGGLDNFLSWYFIDPSSECNDTLGSDPYPVNATDRRHETTWQENERYQIAYLCLHAVWFVSALVMIYGNARKLWGYYVPWLLVTLAICIMDVVVASFFIQDMVTLSSGISTSNLGGIMDFGPMVWAFSMYLRGYALWFANVVEFGQVMNAFCKTYHKRSKQARVNKAHEKELRKQREEHERSLAPKGNPLQPSTPATPPSHPPPSNPLSHPPPSNPLSHPPPSQAPPRDNHRAPARHYSPAQAEPYHNPGPQNYHPSYHQPSRYDHPRYDDPPRAARGYDNDAYDRDHPPVVPYENPLPQPENRRVPSELRPFSYLNPGFRPNHPHDVDGMKAGAKNTDPGYTSDDSGPPRRQESFRGGPPLRRHESVQRQPTRPYPSPLNDPRPVSEYDEPWDSGSPNIMKLTSLPRVNLRPTAPTAPTAPTLAPRDNY